MRPMNNIKNNIQWKRKVTMNKLVYIEHSDHAYRNMFRQREWEVTDDPTEADLIQFTGGADVSPVLYGQNKHPSTGCNADRDLKEILLFQMYDGIKPMAGICRGGQFLNVMCGGKLYQDVNNHGVNGTHEALLYGKDAIQVTSTHHQMMIPHADGTVTMTAKLSTQKAMYDDTGILTTYSNAARPEDCEAVIYYQDNVLCFQPHPEYMGKDSDCQNAYFDMLSKLTYSPLGE